MIHRFHISADKVYIFCYLQVLSLNKLESVSVRYHPMNDLKNIIAFVFTDFSNYIKKNLKCIL